MNTPKIECEEKKAENCTTIKGWQIQDATVEYSKKWYGKVICYPCQIKLGIASGNTK